MANLAQNQNQLLQSLFLGQILFDPQGPLNISVQINPSSSATVICVGQAVKLITNLGPTLLVDVCTGPTDGPVYGVIASSLKHQQYKAGDTVTIARRGSVIALKSSAAIAAGDQVSITPNTVTTNDPTVATDTTSADFIVGVALRGCAGANTLIPIEIAPASLTAAASQNSSVYV